MWRATVGVFFLTFIFYFLGLRFLTMDLKPKIYIIIFKLILITIFSISARSDNISIQFYSDVELFNK